MSEKLTKRQRLALLDLSELPENETWLPVSRDVLSICHALRRKGLAHYREGYPLGFTITPAGRVAISREDGER